MAKVEGLNSRGTRYYLRVIIPDDLASLYGKARVNISLGTSDRREATLLATIKRAEWLSDFEAKRRTISPSEVTAVSPELARLLADRVRATVLGHDDFLRSDLPLMADLARAAWQASRSSLAIPPRQHFEEREDDLMGLTTEEAQALAGLNAVLDGQAATALAGQSLATVLPLVQHEARQLGISFMPKTPGAREALLLALKAYRTAHRERTQRDAGEVIDTPVLLTPAPVSSGKAKTLRDVYNRWKASGDKPRTADTVAACNRALVMYETFAPGKTLNDITREQGDTFRAWLRANEKTPKTARDRLNWLKSLLKYASQTLQWITRHPWEGLAIDTDAASPRRPWSDAELTKVFTTPLHTAYTLPTAWHSGQDAAYWIPLIGLFSGARLGELCQIRTADVQTIEGVPVLVLTDAGEDQRIKTSAGRRSVPVHSELIRLGFLKYVDGVKAAGSTPLWPALKTRKGKPSGYFSRWFSEFRKELGLGSYPDFHCLRHTVRPLMRRAGFSESTMDKITGHETRGSEGTVTYDHFTLIELQAAVEAIRYPALALPVAAPYGVY